MKFAVDEAGPFHEKVVPLSFKPVKKFCEEKFKREVVELYY